MTLTPNTPITQENVGPRADATPGPPWPVGSDNGKRHGWFGFFDGEEREKCPFPANRSDLQRDWRIGWDEAKSSRPALSPPAEVPFSAEDACLACNSPAPVDHIGDATEKVDWARCQRCGGEIQGWICQQCHQEFEENDAGELVFCPSEGVDWERVGPKLVEALEPFALMSSEGVVGTPVGQVSVRTCAEYFHRARAAFAAAQPQSNGE